MQFDQNTTPILESCDNEKIGVRKMHAEFDFEDVMQRAHDVIAGVAPHSAAEARGT